MKRFLLLLSMLALVGCVPSWNPFYSEDNLVFEPVLVGSWQPFEPKDGSRESWDFTKAGDKSYLLSQTDEGGRKAAFEVRLFRLNGHQFLDLYLTRVEGDELKVNAWAGFSLVPAHLLLKVEGIEPTLKLAAMNPDWLQKHLRQHPGSVAHRIIADGNIVLTADTAELQAFLLRHLADRNLFGEAMALQRR